MQMLQKPVVKRIAVPKPKKVAGKSKVVEVMEGCVEFKWRTLGDGRRADICCTNLWMEMLIVIHMMAALALTEANSLMIPKDCYASGSGNGVRVVSTGLAL
ncbi:unnamed protein product [Arabidopsis arenosa]|uniref:Uncharacterized protein n=1 Tax=Arabidopsis arenosa TaxID=38785 RepID=A0A8S1ZY08_ARAAE|nr:unnamed protein product [Arabidopsis arenosa]